VSTTLLRTRGLTKKYGQFYALHDVDIAVNKGEIYGLVGKNGAGKTTLLRMISGQAIQSDGEVELFGETTARGLERARRRTGAMIETPSFYPYLTAAQNLEYYRIQRGVAGRKVVEDILAQVELDKAGRKKFKDFSLGMKQRLGLALAMMDNPDLLILDEPVNGLDPTGIVEFRNLLLRLSHERGITILISSHILSELANMATSFGFLDHGALLQQITAEELQKRCRQYVELVVSDGERTATILERQLHCEEYEVLPGGVIHLYQYLDEPAKVASAVVPEGIQLYSMEVKGSNLEDYFLKLIGGGDRA
jgi:ABC-2 type transport system ATP-binding protein